MNCILEFIRCVCEKHLSDGTNLDRFCESRRRSLTFHAPFKMSLLCLRVIKAFGAHQMRFCQLARNQRRNGGGEVIGDVIGEVIGEIDP